MRFLMICLAMTLATPIARAESMEELAQQFFEASAALDKEYLEGKQACQRRYLMKDAPERDSARYKTCLIEFDEQFQAKRCEFYVYWYEKTRRVSPLVRPENYPYCARGNR